MILCAYIFPNPLWPHITAHAEVLGGPVLCPALLRLTMSHPGGVLRLHQGVGVTDIECWVINVYYIFRNNIIEHYDNINDNYSLKIPDMNS